MQRSSPALAPLKTAHRLPEQTPVKIRPALARKPKVRIGRLPEQKIAEAQLAGGAD
jgi:hypothetical protein